MYLYNVDSNSSLVFFSTSVVYGSREWSMASSGTEFA